MHKSYKFRLNPTKLQKEFFEQSFGCCRYIYNWGLNLKLKTYQETKKSLTAYDLCKELTKLKTNEKLSWLKIPTNESLQKSLLNMDSAFTRFFREKKGFPKFKSKKGSKPSFKVLNNFHIDFIKSKVKIPKLGWVKYFNDGRTFGGKTGTITITKDSLDHYYISILVEDGKSLPSKAKINDDSTTVGIDVGIKTFATLSDGKQFDNPKFLEKLESSLKVHQRRLSKKVKGSNRYHKQRKKVAKIHYKIRNKRDNHIHHVTNELIKNYDTFVIEDLNVEGMLKNPKLAKSISSAAWSKFYTTLQYKSEWNGKNIVRIGRFDPSSKMCNCCGNINKELTLSDRIWTCNNCNSVLDRDINAAINIKKFGLAKQNLIGQQ